MKLLRVVFTSVHLSLQCANGSAKSVSECQASMNMDQSYVLFTEPSKRVSLSMHVAKKKRKNDQGFVCVNE